MRTTLTLDSENAIALQNFAISTGISFKRAVNETLRAGLRNVGIFHEHPKPFRVKPSHLGMRKEFEGKNLSRIADELEIQDMGL